MKISRRDFVAALAASSSMSIASSSWGAPIRKSMTAAKTVNQTLIGTSIEPGMFKNLALSLISLQSISGYAYPAILDGNGYPTSTPPYNIAGEVGIPGNILVSDQMVLKFSGTGAFQLGRGAPGFTVVSGANFVSGGSNFNLSVVGTNARVVFAFAGSVPSRISLSFLAGARFSGMSNLVLCKLSDEAALDKATTPEEMFDDQYIATYRALNAGVIRPMGWTNPNFGNVSQSRYIAPWQTSINISSQRWAPGAWAGATMGTNNYTCAAPPDATKVYVDGEMLQLQFSAANTSTGVTVNSGGRGPVPLLFGTGGATGQPLSVGAISAKSLATLTYDAVLGAFMWQEDGQTPCIPYELQIAFANRINAHYWCNFPAYFDDASVTAITALVRTKLVASLNSYFEYGNEIWNFGFPATHLAAAKGAALGFPSDNGRRVYGWYGARVCQTMGLVTKAWAPRNISQLRRVMAFQAYGATAGTSTYRFQGADLAGSLYANYANKGFANYNAAPNRPIDVCDVLSYATYYSGAQCNNFDANYVENGAANIVGLLAAADNYASGVPAKMASAMAFIDNDIRAGTLTNGKAGGETLLALKATANGAGIYPGWDAVAAKFGKPVECYEGGHESWYPSTQACTSMGISTAYGGPTGKIAMLLNAYKMTDAFRILVQDQISQFMALPTSRTAAWLIIPGTNQWGLSTGDSYSPKFKSWDAIVALNR